MVCSQYIPCITTISTFDKLLILENLANVVDFSDHFKIVPN